MDVPERFQPLLWDLLQQLVIFEKAYGHVPKCQLVVSEEYKQMLQLLSKQEPSNK